MMNEIEIKALATKIADSLYSRFNNRESVELMTGEFETVISEMLKTHCIVSKTKAIGMYEESKRCWLEEAGNPIRQSPLWAEMHQMHSLFGKEIFEPDNIEAP